MTPAPALQMYGSQEDGSIDEHALSSILKTALGVAELTVTDLFRAIDQEEKGRITFGEWLGAGEDAPSARWGRHCPLHSDQALLKPGRAGVGASSLASAGH